MKKPSEIQLMLQVQKGNKLALGELYDRYSGALYAVIIKICRDEGLAQDVLQESFLKIWKKAGQFDPDKGAFYTWAFRLCRNTALNAKRNKKDLIQTEDLSVYKNREEPQNNPVDSEKLKGALSQLSEHHQQALKLVYFEGLTHREAHQVMDVPLGTFKSYIQQALRELRGIYKTSIISIILMIGL
ncbi:MAG: RNA polymerase subunit sigma-24 [Alteromonas sp.]|nr:RNA polymerase subunit sigma-24 [Alteromonas sp.]MAY21946.1 RNA polymerase subunit sigma-24 [Flavobacteriaceae bacterium]|tara:strand:+ start:13674 stop:14231 length:558 start_codon:yes stop_codon:yes gene_type:complete